MDVQFFDATTDKEMHFKLKTGSARIEGKNVLECPMNLSSPSDLGLPAADEMAMSGMIC